LQRRGLDLAPRAGGEELLDPGVDLVVLAFEPGGNVSVVISEPERELGFRAGPVDSPPRREYQTRLHPSVGAELAGLRDDRVRDPIGQRAARRMSACG